MKEYREKLFKKEGNSLKWRKTEKAEWGGGGDMRVKKTENEKGKEIKEGKKENLERKKGKNKEKN